MSEADTTDALRAHLRLHLAEGIGAGLFRRLVGHFGSAEAAGRATGRELQQVRGVGPKLARAVTSVTDEQVEEELDLAARRGIRLLCPADADYPPALKLIDDPPTVLYVLGELTAADAVAFAVVGSRRCTHYGLDQAGRFGGLLGRAGLTVVSGGARGIDTAAHRGALEAGGRTVAVMGAGLAHLYPRENARLYERIVSEGRGAIVSELPIRTAVLAGNFPTRNRIIAGLSLGVMIVEAARRSGSLITARLAAEQGKDVFALPGPVDSPFSQGTNQLIADGARLTQDLSDILDDLGDVGAKLADEGAVEASAPPRPAPPLDETETLLLKTLADGDLPLDDLLRRTGLPSGKATAAMTMLAIKGLVVQRPGGVFAARKPAAG
jgi:DNA processing protein